jgi:REP element-mobilizing transposase RayT
MDNYDEFGFEKFETNEFPLAYLITFRTYGTWLPGDVRGSVGRNGLNAFGGPTIQPSVPLVEFMKQEQSHPSVLLSTSQREIVSSSLSEVCVFREYWLRAENVRSNHVHIVVSASVKPEKIANDFKVYATRHLRTEEEFDVSSRIWSRGASTRYLWKPKHVLAAIEYVLHGQDGASFDVS